MYLKELLMILILTANLLATANYQKECAGCHGVIGENILDGMRISLSEFEPQKLINVLTTFKHDGNITR